MQKQNLQTDRIDCPAQNRKRCATRFATKGLSVRNVSTHNIIASRTAFQYRAKMVRQLQTDEGIRHMNHRNDAATQQSVLWIHGGNLAWSRFYSLYVGLQIKARLAGIATPVYRLVPVYHLD